MKMRRKAILGLLVFILAMSIHIKASPKTADEVDMSALTKKVFPSVVRVEVRSVIRKVATGVVLDKDGLIVTTALVSPRDENIYIINSEGQKIEVEFLGMDSETNLAVLKANDAELVPIVMGNSTDVSAGSWVGVVGMSVENNPQVTQGIVSSVGEDALRLNVSVWKGASGSPVINDKGQMVGLLRGVYSDTEPVIIQLREGQISRSSDFMMNRVEAPSTGLAHAIPLEVVTYISTEIKDKGKVERGWLGISVGEDEKGNVGLIEVEKDSPAEKAGLEEGDVIREFEGKRVNSSEMLVTEVRKRKPGDTVTLKIEREDKAQRVKVTLGEYTRQDIWKEFEARFPALFSIPEGLTPKQSAPRIFRIPEGGKVPGVKVAPWVPYASRKFIGVYLEELNEELSAYFGYEDGVSVLISRIEEGSPAEKAGLKVGDLIISADGKRMQLTDELVDLIQRKEKGSILRLEILREKKKMTIDVEVDEEDTEPFRFYPSQLRQKWVPADLYQIMEL